MTGIVLVTIASLTNPSKVVKAVKVGQTSQWWHKRWLYLLVMKNGRMNAKQTACELSLSVCLVNWWGQSSAESFCARINPRSLMDLDRGKFYASSVYVLILNLKACRRKIEHFLKASVTVSLSNGLLNCFSNSAIIYLLHYRLPGRGLNHSSKG